MATDIYCPNQDCKHIRTKSGLCGKSIISLVLSPSGDVLTLICEDHEKAEDGLHCEDEED